MRSPTRKRTRVQSNFGDRERTGGTSIPRSSSSPLLSNGEQLYRMQPLSSINQQQFQGNPRAIPMPSQSTTSRSYSRSSSQQYLHSYHSPSQPVPGPRHSFANSQPPTASPYSGSDADEDDNDTTEDWSLQVRRRSGSGNITSRRVYNNPSPVLSVSPVIVPMVMARQNIRAPESENGQEISRSKSSLATTGSNTALGKSPNGQANGLEGSNKDSLSNHPIVIGISGGSIQFSVNIDRISPLLFQCLCVLAAIPAMTESFALLMRAYNPQANSGGNTRLDYIASIAWSILTAHQCFAFTTGLLTRWRHYYPLPSTLIRLVALQGICWPATFYTLRFLQYDGIERPLVCWSVIGTTTCITRSIQMWVTSNIDYWTREQDASQYGAHTVASIALGFGEKQVLGGNETEREDAGKRKHLRVPQARNRSSSNGGQSTSVRKWNWNEVVWKCAFPAGVCYFFAAWALLLSRELYPTPARGSR